MTHPANRAIQIGVYLGCATSAFYAGLLCSRALNMQLGGPSGLALIVLLALGLVVLLFGTIIEERILWKGWLSRDAGLPGWIGRPNSRLLASTAPSPLSLGCALGLLWQLL